MNDETSVPTGGRRAPSLWGRRLLALTVDWLTSLAVSAGFFSIDPWATLGVFALQRTVLTATTGSSFGQRLLSMRVTRLDGGQPSIVQSFGRTVALCLVIPVGVIAPDGRGAHDLFAGTRLQRIDERQR